LTLPNFKEKTASVYTEAVFSLKFGSVKGVKGYL